MTSLPLAKTLFFIALSLAPKGAHTFFATSNSDNYVWTQSGSEWSLKQKGLPATAWMARGQEPVPHEEGDVRGLARHERSGDSFVALDNGNQVERQGSAVFYIIDPGAPNQKVYTILYPGAK
jgi:hypothetical protein